MSMSLLNVAPKKVGGRPLLVKVMNKLKTAISLVVTKGADVRQGQDGKEEIVFDGEVGGEKWILPGMSAFLLIIGRRR